MKVILYMAMSVDGYICDRNGSTPWSKEERNAYKEIFDWSTWLIVWSTTYALMRREWELDMIWNPKMVVISSKQLPDHQVTRDPYEALRVLKDLRCENVVVGWGTQTNTLFLKEWLFDEIVIDVEPYLFSEWKRLSAMLPKNILLKRMAVNNLSSDVYQVRYKVSLI